MFIDTKGLWIFVYQETIDMRSGFDRLSHFVVDRMKNSINQGHLYLFLGKNRRRAKALFFDGTGLVLIAKRIEHGRFMARGELRDITEITSVELKQIFNGGLIVRPRVERSFFDSDDAKRSSLPKGIAQSLKTDEREQAPHFGHRT